MPSSNKRAKSSRGDPLARSLGGGAAEFGEAPDAQGRASGGESSQAGGPMMRSARVWESRRELRSQPFNLGVPLLLASIPPELHVDNLHPEFSPFQRFPEASEEILRTAGSLMRRRRR